MKALKARVARLEKALPPERRQAIRCLPISQRMLDDHFLATGSLSYFGEEIISGIWVRPNGEVSYIDGIQLNAYLKTLKNITPVIYVTVTA
ncbi:MAG: hypothetical protein HYS18_13815 [Burkholderiales bacterium]|nr:hypothetical protein [Burkholderiales bacterium]